MIEKVQIHEFRKFKNDTIVLGRYLTAIAGHNATGKSTILALLGHSSELDPQIATPLGGKQFRTEFSQIIRVDSEKDIKSDNLMSFTIKSLDWSEKIEEFNYRSTIQSENRYRLLPVRVVDGKKTSSKMEWPVLYLGLNRVYPFGESDKLLVHDDPRVTFELMKDMLNNYMRILNQTESIIDINAVDTDVTKRSKLSSFGVTTENYNYIANSAGQSNLGQILLAVESFRYLKSEIKEKWNGGMLLIDELDATLHPCAQKKLLDYLYQNAKEIGIQICFTTHSLYLLEHINRYMEKGRKAAGESGEVEINYLLPESNKISVVRNPEFDTMKYDLMMLIPPENVGMKIKVYVEDDEAARVAELMLKKYEERIDIISLELGCDNIIKLFKKDDNFRSSIICLDGDAYNKINGIDPLYRDLAKKVMIVLPDKKVSPERVLYSFLFMENTDLSEILNPSVGLTLRNIEENFRRDDQKIMSDRDAAKSWFKLLYSQQPTFMNDLIQLYTEKHSKECKEFLKSFRGAFNYLAGPKRIPKVR